MDYYDRDYYERGLETGKSNYQNYRWIPELTIPMAMAIIDHLEIKYGQTILDWGCAKGYLVKAFRWLNRKAWGVDVSRYAVENCDPEIQTFCRRFDFIFDLSKFSNFPVKFDFCIAKDVFEHMRKVILEETLENLKTDKLFVIIPFGKDGRYFSPPNNLDKSHIICEDLTWWMKFFTENRWNVTEFITQLNGIKDHHPLNSHGFFTMERM